MYFKLSMRKWIFDPSSIEACSCFIYFAVIFKMYLFVLSIAGRDDKKNSFFFINCLNSNYSVEV